MRVGMDTEPFYRLDLRPLLGPVLDKATSRTNPKPLKSVGCKALRRVLLGVPVGPGESPLYPRRFPLQLPRQFR